MWRIWDYPTHFDGDWGCVLWAYVGFLDGLGSSLQEVVFVQVI